jgi:hypothetical protein
MMLQAIGTIERWYALPRRRRTSADAVRPACCCPAKVVISLRANFSLRRPGKPGAVDVAAQHGREVPRSLNPEIIAGKLKCVFERA